jgi:hypothetical protein
VETVFLLLLAAQVSNPLIASIRSIQSVCIRVTPFSIIISYSFSTGYTMRALGGFQAPPRLSQIRLSKNI